MEVSAARPTSETIWTGNVQGDVGVSCSFQTQFFTPLILVPRNSCPTWKPATLALQVRITLHYLRRRGLCFHFGLFVDSAPARSLLFFVVDSVAPSVCLFVCNASFKSILLLCFSMESSHFLTISSP